MSTQLKRHQVSVLNALLCLLVVFIHVSSESITAADKDSWKTLLLYVPWIMSSFAMQGFVLLSGIKVFLKYSSDPFIYRKFLLDRSKRIILPYLIWVVIYYLYFCHKALYIFSFPQLISSALIGNMISPFYFIIVILQFYLLMPIWKKIIPAYHPCFVLPAALLLTIVVRQVIVSQYNDRVFTTYLIYWMAGCYIGSNYDEFIILLKKNRAFIYLMLIISGCLDLYCKLDQRGRHDLHLFYSLSMLLCLIQIAGYIKSVGMTKWVKKINDISLGIFFSHSLFIYMINFYMSDIGIGKISIRFILRAVFVYSMSYLCCSFYKKTLRALTRRVC